MLRPPIPKRRKASREGAGMEVSYFLKKRNTSLRTLFALSKRGAEKKDGWERKVTK